MEKKQLNAIRLRRKTRARSKIFGIENKPRLSVFRSNKSIYVQLIDDLNGKTLASASTAEIKTSGYKGADKQQTANKIKLAEQLGELIAKKALEKNIKSAVFSRGNYAYHGRVKAVAEGARKGGLKI